jgi:hypothetical protein
VAVLVVHGTGLESSARLVPCDNGCLQKKAYGRNRLDPDGSPPKLCPVAGLGNRLALAQPLWANNITKRRNLRMGSDTCQSDNTFAPQKTVRYIGWGAAQPGADCKVLQLFVQTGRLRVRANRLHPAIPFHRSLSPTYPTAAPLSGPRRGWGKKS